MDMQREKRDARTYRHRICGGRTTVGGDDLIYVANIFHHPDRTRCSRCNDYFPMHEFVWDDTGESLTDYYSRYAGQFVGLNRFLAADAVFTLIALGALVGGVAGFLVGRTWGTLAAISIAVLGVLVVGFMGFVLGASISQATWQRVLGTHEYTSLD